MGTTDNIIEMRNVSKTYTMGIHVGGHRTLASTVKQWLGFNDHAVMQLNALNNISLEIKQGETIGLVGVNGSGKSTLLKIINRVTTPTSGLCRVRGKVGSLLEVGAGFYAELSGNENIAVVGAILGMTKHGVKMQYNSIVEFAELSKELMETPVKRYSSGQYLRLAFSVSAHLDTSILLVDEVVSVGDPEFQKKCLSKIRSLANEGRTVVFVSHHLNLVSDLCDRVIWIEKGRIVQDGNCDDVLPAYRKALT